MIILVMIFYCCGYSKHQENSYLNKVLSTVILINSIKHRVKSRATGSYLCDCERITFTFPKEKTASKSLIYCENLGELVSICDSDTELRE